MLCFVLAGALLGFLRWNFHPAKIFSGTSGVQFVGLHAGGPVDPGDGQGRGGAPGPRRADHRYVLDHRPPPVAAPVAVHAGPPAHPSPPARPRASRTGRPCWSSTACAPPWRCSPSSSPAPRCCTRSSWCSSPRGSSCSCRSAATSGDPTSSKPRPTSRRDGAQPAPVVDPDPFGSDRRPGASIAAR